MRPVRPVVRPAEAGSAPVSLSAALSVVAALWAEASCCRLCPFAAQRVHHVPGLLRATPSKENCAAA